MARKINYSKPKIKDISQINKKKIKCEYNLQLKKYSINLRNRVYYDTTTEIKTKILGLKNK